MTFDVSIIIPAYCTTELSLGWLAECVQSAVIQDCEVVVYDDGSPLDITPYTKNASKVVLDNANMGASYARNRAIEFATQPLILPLDCDDRLKPDAVKVMRSMWNGIPLYPDIAKFGIEDDPHFALLDFHCDLLTQYVGFASVNLLHSKKQWEAVGGYNEKLKFYEDGEYGARLMGTFCGQRVPQPLVEYRQHPGQKTRIYSESAHDYAVNLMKVIRSMDMACATCGGKRRGTSNAEVPGRKSTLKAAAMERGPSVTVQVGTNPMDLPSLFEGKVLAHYIGGKGMAKHFYKGIKSKTPYRVEYGEYLYANPADVGDPGTTWSFLIKVVKPEAPAAPKAAAPRVQAATKAAAMPAMPVVRTPVEDVVETPPSLDKLLPPITDMNVKAIVALEGIDSTRAQQLIAVEQAGLNRKKVLEWLKSKL